MVVSISNPLAPSPPIPIKVLLERFLLADQVEWNCPSCSHKSAVLEHSIVKCPEILILHLKRFTVDPQTYEPIKRSDTIRAEETLVLGIPTCFWDIGHSDHRCLDQASTITPNGITRTTRCEYSLNAVISHIGLTPSSGHYICDVKVGNGWEELDDEKSTLNKDYSPLTRKRSSYVLIYSRTKWAI